MSAHTFLGPFIIMLRLEDHTRCLIQLCSSSVIMSLSLCTPVLYGILLLIVHTLCLAQFVVQLDFTYTHLWGTHCAWIGFTAVHLYFSPVSAHSWTVYTTTLYNCTTEPVYRCEITFFLVSQVTAELILINSNLT